MTKPIISGQTFMFAKALTHIMNAITYLKVLKSDEKPSGKVKKMFNDWIRMLTRMKMDAYDGMPLEFRTVFDEQLTNDDVTLQIDGINDMILALPPAKRDEIEKYIQVQYDVYGKKEAIT